jgi:hypothetical protein
MPYEAKVENKGGRAKGGKEEEAEKGKRQKGQKSGRGGKEKLTGSCNLPNYALLSEEMVILF